MLRRNHVEEHHGNQERWLLTYADLITLLMVFFVVLYSMSKVNAAQFARLNHSLQRAFNIVVLEGDDKTAIGGVDGGAGDSLLEDLSGMRTALMSVAQDIGIDRNVAVSMRKEGIAISLSGNVLFESGRADLRPEMTKMLDQIAVRLAQVPNEIRVEGHTDNVPIDSDQFPSNWELSSARATMITRYLAENGGIDPKRLSAQGYGEFRPVVPNDTRDHRAQNRRIDILVVYPNTR